MNIKQALSIILTLLLSFTQPAYADSTDSALRYADKKEWNKALKSANSYPDPVLRKIILSKRFFDTSYNENSFEEVTAFIQNNPNWPRINALKEIAENYLSYDTKAHYIVKWFSHNHPRTPNGHKFYAISAPKIITDKAHLEKILKECWIYGSFSPEESKPFLAKNKGIITTLDHSKKIDQLLWHNSREEAKKLLNLVGTGGKAAYAAHIALLDNKPNKEALFHKLPKEYKYNSGILFQYLDQYKKADIISHQIAELLLHAPQDKMHHKDWWRLKNIYAKNMLQQHKYQLAYNIAHKHIGSCNKDKSDSEWLSGWIALSFLHKPELAYKHFQNMHESVKYPISLARAAYWLGLTAEAMKNKELTHKWWREAAAFNFTFYGQIAMIEMHNETMSLPPKPQITATDRNYYKKNELSRATNLFIKHKKFDIALEYAQAAIASAKNIGETALIVASLNSSNNRYYMSKIVGAAIQKGFFMMPDNPTPYKIPKTKIEPALTYAIIQKESAFNQYAVSHANCHGLMQVLPATGCTLAKKLKQKCSTKRLTSDPTHNITLGNKYLVELVDKYNGSYLLAIASYNAGPHVIDRWLAKPHGDPRKLKTIRQVIHWIESMPYYETRDYVQRVLENVQVYRKILNKQAKLELKKDLFRGSSVKHK